MPAAGPNSLILVTGASGFLAAHCCLQLLERGHSVRGTVRSNEKGDYLKQLFARHGDKFTYVIADDLETPGVFDNAVKGVDGVLHTASPFHMDAEGKAQTALINPALKGTKSVLASIAKEPKIQRVVITSSFASIIDMNGKTMPYTFTEADWNETDPAAAAKDGQNQAPLSAYRASKTLAERAAWEFVETNQVPFDIVTINPPLVMGPIIHQVKSPDALNTSAKNIWNLIHGGQPNPGAAVDVRDTAQAHVEALLRGQAGNQRYAPTIGVYNWQQCADIVHNSKRHGISDEWKKGTRTEIEGDMPKFQLDGSKSERELGLQYHSLQAIIEDTLESFQDYIKRDWKGVPSEEIIYLK